MPSSAPKLPWPILLVAAYLLPGAGHALYGEIRRGIIIGGTVLSLFVLGIFVGGVRIVEFPNTAIPSVLGKLLSQPAFLGQFFAGPIALVAGALSRSAAADPNTAGIMAHARLFDIAQLYTAIAGALNLLAIIDITGRSFDRNEPRPDRLLETSSTGDTQP